MEGLYEARLEASELLLVTRNLGKGATMNRSSNTLIVEAAVVEAAVVVGMVHTHHDHKHQQPTSKHNRPAQIHTAHHSRTPQASNDKYVSASPSFRI